MADPPADSPHALVDFLRRATSSPANPLSLNSALALVKNGLPPNTSLSIAQAPPAMPDLDADPLPSLLDSFAPVASTSTALLTSSPAASTGALVWLKTSLCDDVRVAHVIEVLQSGSSDAEIQGELLDIWGFEGIEDVGEAVRRRAEIVAEAAADGGKLRMNGSAHEPLHHADSHPSHPSSILSAHARDYTPGSQVSFATAEEVQAAKLAKKAHKRDKGKERADGNGMDGSPDVQEWLIIREEQLAHGPGALVSGRRPAIEDAPQYPNIYLASKSAGVSIGGQRLALPVGTTRDMKELYEEITIPAPKAVPFRFNESLVPIGEMDAWGKRTFHAYKTLNRLQSVVYPVAYKSNENMLVCAPTGAGKTDVALLAILRCLSNLASTPLTSMSDPPKLPPASAYKIVYVAPLKALAAEVTLKFAKRLAWAGVKVRELTGDMKLTKKEVDETGVIVTTPEKWDVVTRKGAGSGDGEVADKVKLLIIDEVHLLHEDRGAVIESIVARTLRQVESSQSLIRIVGLSATLPNYVDVADFLGVNRYTGLFFFDSSFRPVPLEQHFVGVKGKPGSPQSRTNLDNAAFDKVAELIKAGHQCMVFVHARKETVKTAQMLREKFLAEGLGDLLDPSAGEDTNGKWQGFKRDLASSRNREMKELAAAGFGIHHAGMLRSDRNISERMFEANVTKVLCCTATLAWGVNLPAYAVVIKGTQVYDSGKGAFVDLSILDVLQIFGRAGRPQYEDQGVGYICTTNDKIDHYVSAITQQHPIESKFTNGLADSLNAEISLGTVTNMDEGVRWLGYSYLFVRMRKNPLVYGMTAAEVEQDPLLGSKRHALINNAAKRLVECQMISFDRDLGTFTSTDLGRIAARYYIRDASIEIFNKLFRPRMSEADILALIAASVEFEQIQVRESEVDELKKLIEASCPCQVKGGTESSAGKVNVLLQAYISRAYIEDFALVSDTGYVSQNAGRIVRALLEIAMAKRWAPVSLVLLNMSKAIEKRMWPFAHPLAQFDLPADLLYNIERWADDVPISEVAAMSDADFGALVHQNERLGGFATRAARQLPALFISSTLQPLAHDLLRVRIELQKSFEWSEKHHGAIEAFWVWLEDEENLCILGLARSLIRPHTTAVQLQFTVAITAAPKSFYVRAISDRWIGAEEELFVDLATLVLPPPPAPHLPLLDLPLLSPHDAFAGLPHLQQLYGRDSPTFDPMQTQAFHTIFHTASNALVASPSSASRATLLELAMWRTFGINPTSTVLYLTPRRALARQAAMRLRTAFSGTVGIPVQLVSRAEDLDSLAGSRCGIAVASPAAFLRILRKRYRPFAYLNLVVAHELHALDAAYELALSRLRWIYPATRVVGSSSALADVSSLADWLDVPEHASYSFSPATRTSSLTTNVQPFSTPHSFALLRQMVKPAYDAMRIASGSTIAFVPSRSQCRTTAKDLVTHSASDIESSFVADGALDMVAAYAESLSDESLAEALTHGIAVFHEGLTATEQRLALELFGAGIVKVLIVSREACWTLPVHGSLVIVMSSQYVTVRTGEDGRDEREVQAYPVPDLLQMQSLAVPPSAKFSAECLILCQKDQAELYGKFFQHGAPLESGLPLDPALSAIVFEDLANDRIRDRHGVVDLLSWTFASRRLVDNPSYYATEFTTGTSTMQDDLLSRLADSVIDILESRCAVLPSGRTDILVSQLGRYFADKAIPLDEVQRLQKIPLDELARSVGGKSVKQNGHSVKDGEGEKEAVVEEATDSHVRAFFQRLPRAVKNDIGEHGNFKAEESEQRILLAAFRAGRIPRGKGGLEERQRDLVERVVQSRV
ncbi:DNA/RNA helicase, DEAD/DEAH boxtype [Rhodotorula toruloides]|uniref:DNA/RNA helicase, DEAD/DEAH boxtype n=1 Tax=Rhodotorula toruloides TaxID=5286 RepID=A0A511KGQ6_RHOTO|nr:DNA/RNA helicase, DEAD/DEAH boxtype [Rhodotorula toruloides]